MSVAGRGEAVPTIDLRRADAGASARTNLLRDPRAAARGFGFFYLVGHGDEEDLISWVLNLSSGFFFAPPTAQKLSIEMVNSPYFRGYNRAGVEHARGSLDWREQLDGPGFSMRQAPGVLPARSALCQSAPHRLRLD